MANKSIGAGIALTGEKEYRQAITGINKDMSVLSSEMQKVSAEFDGNANSIGALTAKQSIYAKKLEEQKQKIDILKSALSESSAKYGENDAKTKNWQISLNKAEAELTKLNGEVKTNEKYLNEAKTSTDKTAKSINEYGQKVEAAEKKTSVFGEVLKANLTGAAIIAGVKALSGAINDLTTGAAAYADEIGTMSAQTGIATDTLQELKYMEELTDVPLETLTASMAKQIKSMKSAQDGTKIATDAYKELGVEYKNADGSLRDSETVYWDIIDALGNMENETQRDAYAMTLLGKSAQDINPVIKIGSEGVAKFADEAHRAGAVLSDETLTGLMETDDALQRLSLATTTAKNKFGAEMAPAITAAANKITAKVNDMGDSFSDFAGGALDKATDGLLWVVDNAGTVAAGIGGVAAAYAAYKIAVGVATVVQTGFNLATIATPWGLIAGAIGGVAAAVAVYASTTDDATEAEKKEQAEFDELIASSNELNQSIEDGIASREENIDKIEAESGASQKLADSLYDLAEKENKTAAEKSAMSALVDELNKSLPELNLSIDAETGLLSKQRGEVEKLIEYTLELYKVKAYQESLTANAAEQISLEESLATAATTKLELQKQITAAQEEYDKKYKENEDKYWGGDRRYRAYEETNKELEEEKKHIDNLESSLSQTNNEIATSNDRVSQLKEAWRTAMNFISDHSAITEAATANEALATAITDGYDGLLKEQEDYNKQSYDNEVASYNEKSKTLDKELKAEKKARDKANEDEIKSVKSATDEELSVLEKAHDDKIALINSEYLAKIKLVDEERYKKLSALDDEISEIEAAQAADEAAEEAKAEAAKRAELEKAIATAENTGDRKAAQDKLKEYEADLAADKKKADREAQVDELKAKQDTIEAEYDAKVKALEAQQKVAEEAAATAYDTEKDAIGDRLSLKLDEISTRKELDDEYYADDAEKRKANLLAERDATLASLKETNAAKLEETKAANAAEVAAMGSSNEDMLKAAKKFAEKASAEMKEAGGNTVEGYVSGVAEAMAALEDAMKDEFKVPAKIAREEMKIKSPSKVFYEMGDYSAQGYVLGLKERMQAANREIAGSFSFDIQKQANNGLSANMAKLANNVSAALNVNSNQNVNVTSTPVNLDGRTVGRILYDYIKDEGIRRGETI